VPSVGTRELDLYTGAADAIEIRQTNAFDIIDKNAWLNNGTVVPLKPGIRVWVRPTIAINYIMLNPRFAPFDNVLFRQALAYAFPYQKFISTALNGFATKLNAPIPPGMNGYDPSIQGYNYDPDKARALFQQVNFNGTIELIVQTGDANNLAAALMYQDSLADLAPNINVKVTELEYAGWSDLWHHQKLPMDIGTWTMDIPDPSDLLPNWVTPMGFVALTTEFGNNATLTKLCDDAAGTLDPVRRQAMYSEIQREILRKSPDIMLTSPMAIFAERDWVLPANDSTGGTFYTGRAINNVESGDGAGGINGGYHAYLVYKAQTTQQVAVDIGSTPVQFVSATWAPPATAIEVRLQRPPNYS
jgi:ABC-type transport system substrate-binding protein